jgi:hypothetical protein
MNLDAPPVNAEVVGSDKQFSAPWKRSINQLYSYVKSAAAAFLAGGITAGTGIAVSGTWPNQTVTNTSPGSGTTTPVPDGQVLANIANVVAPPIGNTMSAILDHVFGNTQGLFLVRGVSGWQSRLIAAGDLPVLTISTQTASYVLVLADGDGNTEVLMNVAGANTLTVPPHSSVAIPVGRTVLFGQKGAGTTTITAGVGVTLRTASSLTTRVQYSSGGMTQIATDEWYVFGDLT